MLDLDQGSGSVTFDAVGRPSALKIHAKGDPARGKLTAAGGKLNGTVSFKLDSLDTGIGMRNEHMKKKYLETGKFPEAKLAIKDVSLPAGYAAPDFSADGFKFSAASLHGVDKPVDVTAKLSRSAHARPRSDVRHQDRGFRDQPSDVRGHHDGERGDVRSGCESAGQGQRGNVRLSKCSSSAVIFFGKY